LDYFFNLTQRITLGGGSTMANLSKLLECANIFYVTETYLSDTTRSYQLKSIFLQLEKNKLSPFQASCFKSLNSKPSAT